MRRTARNGYSVAVRLSDGSTYPRDWKAGLRRYAHQPGTGSFDAQAEIPNPDHALLPGQFVRVVLQGATRPDVIVVPQRAVLDSPQGKFVYVPGKSQDGSDVALPRPVTVGDWVEFDGQPQWIVESGLKPGDIVIVEGTAKIFPVPGGAPIMLGPPPGAEAKGAPPEAGKGASGEVKKSEATEVSARSWPLTEQDDHVFAFLHRPADLRRRAVDLHRASPASPRCACCRSRSTRRSLRRS